MRMSVEIVRGTYADQVAAEVRAHAARRRVTVSTLARKTDVSIASMSRKMNGHQPFSLDELAGVAQALHVPIGDLLPEPRQWAPRGSNPQPTDSRVRHLLAVAA